MQFWSCMPVPALRCGLIQKVLGGLSLESEYSAGTWLHFAILATLFSSRVCSVIVPAGLSWLLLLIVLLKLLRLLLLSQGPELSTHNGRLELVDAAEFDGFGDLVGLLCVVGNTNELACSLIILPALVRSEELLLVWRSLFEGRMAISWTVDFLMVLGGPTSTALASNERFTNANFFTELRLSTLWELLLLHLRLTTLWYHATVDHVRFVGTYATNEQG